MLEINHVEDHLDGVKSTNIVGFKILLKHLLETKWKTKRMEQCLKHFLSRYAFVRVISIYLNVGIQMHQKAVEHPAL